MWHSHQASVTTFPHVYLFTKLIILLRWSLNVVVSYGRVLGPFIPLPPAVLIGFPQEANLSLEVAVGRFVFQCCVRRVSLTEPKHLDSCFTFHKADVSSRAFSSYIVSSF